MMKQNLNKLVTNAGVAYLIVWQWDKISHWKIAQLVAITMKIVKELNIGTGVQGAALNVEVLITPQPSQIFPFCFKVLSLQST